MSRTPTRRPVLGALAALALTAVSVLAGVAPSSAQPQPAHDLDDGCFVLRVTTTGTAGGPQNYVEKASVGYGTRGTAASAEPIGFEATALGRYRLTDTTGGALYRSVAGFVWAGSSYGAEADWTITRDGAAYRIAATATGDVIGSVSGRLTVSDASFALEPATGCAVPPGVSTGVLSPGTAPTVNADGTLHGLVDAHAHLTASAAFGGSFFCGEPFSPGGVEVALAGCASHTAGPGALFESVIGGSDLLAGDDGWPTFTDWPSTTSLLHEGAYYTGLERAKDAGLTVVNALLVANRVICELYPERVTDCDEGEQIEVQVDLLHDLQDYVDAQSGGPGAGWFRIARTPQEVRDVVADGKLAVTIGVEASEMFGCRVVDDVPQCDEADVDAGLDALEALGVSGLYPVHKFDNAFGGTRFDEGATGAVINLGNYLSTGRWWTAESCTGPSDHEQPIVNDDLAALLALLAANPDQVGTLPPAGTTLPVYPSGPLCNTRGLTDLGEYLVEQMMDRGMIIHVDHMGVRTADAVLDLAEDAGYAGIASVHSWSDLAFQGRVAQLGGFVASYPFPSGGTAADPGGTTFLTEWQDNVAAAGPGVLTAYGYGSDVNGLGAPPAARASAVQSPLVYPFTAVNGAVVDRSVIGQRTFDVNVDGVAHYGLYPDWIADVLQQAGADRPVLEQQLMDGAEAYVAMWEESLSWAS